MNQKTTILRIAQTLVLLNALAWIAVGAANLVLHPPAGGGSLWTVIYSAGFFAYGLVLAFAGLALSRWQGKAAWRAALALMILTVVLFIFDDFGLADLLAMLPALAAGIYLLVFKKPLSLQAA